MKGSCRFVQEEIGESPYREVEVLGPMAAVSGHLGGCVESRNYRLDTFREDCSEYGIVGGGCRLNCKVRAGAWEPYQNYKAPRSGVERCEHRIL